MKKLYTLLLLLVVSLASCSKYLKEVPQNKLMPSTVSDFEQLLNHGYISRSVMPYIDVASDDVILKESDHVQPDADDGDCLVGAYMWDPTHETTLTMGDHAFDAFYESIFYANIVLENIQDSKPVSNDVKATEKSKNNIEGQAYALRAYSYFYLVNLYAQPYDPATAAETPGMPINNSTSAPLKAYTRSPLADVYNLIVEDLNKAIPLLEENPIEQNGKFQFNALSAKLLLSRVYLYMQNYEESKKWALQVLAENSTLFNLHKYGFLNPDNNHNRSFSEKYVPGPDYLGIKQPNILFVNGLSEIYPALNWWPFMTTFSVNPELQESFDLSDIRRYYFMQTYSRNTYAGYRTKLSYAKNRARGLHWTAEPSCGYTRTLRVEEAVMNVAESAAFLGDLQTAVDYLNQLRVQKYREGEYTALNAGDFTKESLIEFIFQERRREFCFEGLRWFDLRRSTRPAMTRLGYKQKVASLEKDDLRYTFQIPAREIDVNPQIGKNPR